MSASDQGVLLEAVLQSRKRLREHLALALHDDICQSITAAGLALDLLRMDLPPTDGERVTEVQEILETAFERVRRLSHETHPDPVKRFGFVSSMERLVESARTRFKGTINARIEPCATVDLARATAVYEIAEAAIDNVVRHANGGEMWLTTVDGKLEVRDNGAGFDVNTPKCGLGLTLMAFLARRCGLSLGVTSTAGRGTIVTLR